MNVDGTDYVVQTLIAKPKNSSSNLLIKGNQTRDFPDKESKNAILRMLSQTYKDIKAYLNGGGYVDGAAKPDAVQEMVNLRKFPMAITVFRWR